MPDRNRELVERSLALLRDGLSSFVSMRIHEAVKENLIEMTLLKRFIDDPILKDRPVSTWDVAALLRIMRETWNRVFRQSLDRSVRNLVFETSDIRNAWAHQQDFGDEDTERALDTIRRLLGALNAPQAEEVTQLRAAFLDAGRQGRPRLEGGTIPLGAVPARADLKNGPAASPGTARVDKQRFREEIGLRLSEASKAGRNYLDLNSGQIHRDLGGYPGKGHKMASCCDVMREIAKPGDRVISSPPKGKGASLTIRYQLPR